MERLGVRVGGVEIGGGSSVVIQSMTTTRASDVEGSVLAAAALVDAGADLVRITAPTVADARCFGVIGERLSAMGKGVPLVADVHYSPSVALAAVEGGAAKVRINPGNYCSTRVARDKADYKVLVGELRGSLAPLLEACGRRGAALRVGVNQGSLAPRIIDRWGAGVEGMVSEALEVLQVCRGLDFHSLVISLKSSDACDTVLANRMFDVTQQHLGYRYPIHLGVTEAGDGVQGWVKSALGIGLLLLEGIGDTVRVSLTGDPVEEPGVAREIVRCAQELREGVFSTPADADYSLFLRLHPVERCVLPEAVNMFGTQARGWLGVDWRGLSVEEVVSRLLRVPYGARGGLGLDGGVPDIFLIPVESLGGILGERLGWLSDRLFVEEEGVVGRGGLPDLVSVDGEFCFAHLSAESFLIGGSGPEFLAGAVSRGARGVVVECTGRDAVLGWFAASLIRAMVSFEGWVGDDRFPIFLNYLALEGEREDLGLCVRASLAYGGALLDGYADGFIVRSGLGADSVCACGYQILQSLGYRREQTEYIACPSCGRTLFDISSRLREIRAATQGQRHLRIGVMGCIVNGPGEMRGADYGYVGSGPGMITLYRGEEPVVRGVPEGRAVEELVNLIRSDGRWEE